MAELEGGGELISTTLMFVQKISKICESVCEVERKMNLGNLHFRLIVKFFDPEAVVSPYWCLTYVASYEPRKVKCCLMFSPKIPSCQWRSLISTENDEQKHIILWRSIKKEDGIPKELS